MSKIDAQEILELAALIQDFSDTLNQENLLDTVYVNENVHSRILRLILQYHRNRENPFFESFLRIKKIAAILPNDLSPGSPHFFNERDRIDLLIEGKDYAIIVENKIYWAEDQDKQIERYLFSCLDRFDENRIFVLYLTADGSKRVSDKSLTEKARQILGLDGCGAKGRFAEISFKYDILPWLRESIKVSVKGEYRQINAALIQYADYLSGLFGTRESKSKYNRKVMAAFENEGIKSISAYNEYIEATTTLVEELAKKRDDYCRELADKYISLPLKDYCSRHGVKLVEKEYSYNWMCIRIAIPCLEKSSFSLHTEGDGRNIYGISNYEVGSFQFTDEDFKKKFEPRGFRRTPWWPAYKWPIKEDNYYLRPASSEFWETVVRDGSFVRFVIRTYEGTVRCLESETE